MCACTGYVRGKQNSGECTIETTKSFMIKVGLHQGSALSPFLFAVIMADDCSSQPKCLDSLRTHEY